jgi:hypothetical protein
MRTDRNTKTHRTLTYKPALEDWRIVSEWKRARQKFDLEKFDLRKLDDLQVMEKYQVEISNRFAALENLDESVNINSAWENIR